MIYVPSASAEKMLAGKPDVYKQMFENTQRLYHHIAEECLPPHEIGGVGYVEAVTGPDSIIVDVARKPKAMHESIEEYHRTCEDTLRHALHLFHQVGHPVE